MTYYLPCCHPSKRTEAPGSPLVPVKVTLIVISVPFITRLKQLFGVHLYNRTLLLALIARIVD